MAETDQKFPPAAETEVPKNDSSAVTWTASEFIAHEKTSGWYAGLAGIALLLSVVIFLLTRDILSVAVIVVGAVFLGVYGSRPPRQLEYTVDNRGVVIDGNRHGFNEYKSFSVVSEGAFSSLVFMPLRRFATLTTIYYAPQDEEKIMAVLSTHLPYEEPRRDAVDTLMRRIRF
jgi:hypothetical protein